MEFSQKEEIPLKEWEVEKILEERKKRKKIEKTGKYKYIKEYLIKWVGYEYPSWEPEENLENCQESLKDFKLNKNKKKKGKKEKGKEKKKIISKKSKLFQLERTESFILNNSKKRKLSKNKNNENENKLIIPNIYTNNELSNKEENNFDSLNFLNIKEEDNTYYDFTTINNKVNEESTKYNNNNDINCYEKIKLNNDIYLKDPNNCLLEYYEKAQFNQNETIENNDLKTDYNQILDEDVNMNTNKYFNELFKNNSLNNNLVDPFDFEKENNNELKILEIYNMKVPNDSEKGIILNIKYKKNNKIFIEEFNTKYEEVPTDCLIKYYEMFIHENFKGKNYNKDMIFN